MKCYSDSRIVILSDIQAIAEAESTDKPAVLAKALGSSLSNLAEVNALEAAWSQAANVDKIYSRFHRHCVSDQIVGATLSTEHVHQMQYYFALSLMKTDRLEQARDMLSQCAVEDAEKGYGAQCQASLQELTHSSR